jgi:hypothetical protein
MSVLAQLAQASDYYNYDYSYSNSATDGAAAVIFGGIALVFVLFFAVIAYAVHAFLLGRIFKKAGVEQWIAWVPFYNTWKLLEIGGQPGFWAVLAIIPIVNIVSAVFVYISMYHIGLKLQKEGWFILIAIFLPLVWLIWLAFDDSKWQGVKPVAVTPKKVTTKTEEK